MTALNTERSSASTRRHASAHTLVVPVSGYVGPSEVDVAVGALEDRTRTVCLDLTAATFLDMAALMMIVAHVSTRSREGWATSIRLPESQKPRDFMRAWNFAPGIKSATGERFLDLVDERDHGYFGEQQRHYLPKKVAVPREALMQELVATRFFGLTSYELAGDPGDLAVLESEGNRWQRPALVRTLADRLGGPVGDISRVHIFELMANVLEHPAASRAAVMSFANPDPRAKRDNFFTLCVWDDGMPIPETLRRTLQEKRGLRVEEAAVPDVFTLKAESSERNPREYPVSWTPGARATDEELLLSSFFPGISQKNAPTGHWFNLHVDGKEDSGLGLYNLYKSVVDTFGGSLSVRAGRHFANIKADKDRKGVPIPDHYRMRIDVLPEAAAIRGNVFTVRLPLV